jgi:hypothetical protein
MTSAMPTDLPPELARFLALWERKRKSRAMPSRQDFTLEELWPWMGRLHLVELENGGADGRYRVFATASTERFRQEMTGRLISDYQPDDLALRALEDHRSIVAAAMPVTRTVNDLLGGTMMHWTRLAVPLGHDGSRMDRYFVALHFWL